MLVAVLVAAPATVKNFHFWKTLFLFSLVKNSIFGKRVVTLFLFSLMSHLKLKRKEYAQEVEVVSVYNKRLRKSFMKIQNVKKHLRHAKQVQASKTPSGSDVLRFHEAGLADPTPAQEADLAAPLTSKRFADGDKNQRSKKKNGKVRLFHSGFTFHYLNRCNVQTQNEFLEDWLPLRTTYLRELLELEAPFSNNCQICTEKNFQFRCNDCIRSPLTCSECCIKQHGNTPFHSIYAWNGTCFVQSDLLRVELVLYLGHLGLPCPKYSGNEDLFESDEETASASDNSSANTLQIVHSNGVCQRRIRYCKCPNAPPLHIQLFRHRLFPASYRKPQTAFTFEVLDHFHIQAMECKTSAGAFYAKLKRLTSNAFPDTVPVGLSLSLAIFWLISWSIFRIDIVS
jgi:hypothetical protein